MTCANFFKPEVSPQTAFTFSKNEGVPNAHSFLQYCVTMLASPGPPFLTRRSEMKKKHLTKSQRIQIQTSLTDGKKFSQIGKEIGVSETTISREVRNHAQVEKKGAYGRSFNDCKKRKRCPVSNACSHSNRCKHTTCRDCNEKCSPGRCEEYEKEVCYKLARAPYVCNSCKDTIKCTLERHYYYAAHAQAEYEETLSESRQVIHVTQEELEEMNCTLSNGSRKNQSINHITSYAGDAFPVAGRTVYNYVNSGLFPDVKRIDLPKAVRYSKRKKEKAQRVDGNREIYNGRTYADYAIRVNEDPSVPIVQMDTVEGPKGGSGVCLLTLEFPVSKLQLAFRLEAKTSENVVACFTGIKEILGEEAFKKLFKLILTDRGSEFSDPESIEDLTGGEVFFCKARHAEQKGACEKNHVEIRKVIPKGKDMSPYSQEQIQQKMMSHINSYSRPTDANKTAYEMFCFYYESGEEILEKLGVRKINKADINLTPALLEN